MVARRKLRDALRRLREGAGFTQREVAEEMDWSLSKIIRMETGQVAVTTTDLRALLRHYDTDAELSADLVELARAARQRAWWSVYRGIASSEYLAYIGFESSAQVIRNFEPVVVPGLLQTPDYARETMMRLGLSRVDELVELRMARQELLTRDDAPNVHFIMDHSVVQRAVGGPALMRRQLRHILAVAEYPNVTVRVVPWWEGLYANYRMAYVLFEFAEEEPDVLFREAETGEMITVEGAQEDTPGDYLASFWELEQLAPTAMAPTLLDAAIASMAQAQPPGGGGAPFPLTALPPPNAQSPNAQPPTIQPTVQPTEGPAGVDGAD